MSADLGETGSAGVDGGGIRHDDGLLLVAGDGLLTTFPLSRGEIVIGRAPECDVVISHSVLSRRHVRLRLGPIPSLEDLGSRNGTRLLGARIEAGRPVPVAAGQSFQIGPLSFVIVRLRRAEQSVASGSYSESLRVVDPTHDAVSALVRDLAKSNLSVLVLGETGVGKEVLAETIHRWSGRSGAFVRINCAAIAPSLIESELFGHEKAAFTGALHQRPGLMEAAQRGTVFLDEVGELPEAIQAKLLRAIESREITRVGGVKPLALDVRFVAATNRDLAAEIAKGRFRSDLYYRLDGVTLVIPPLRDCRKRVGPLAMRFLQGASAGGMAPTAPQLDAELLARLEAHDWPGNVRELKAVIERALILARGGEIKPRHLAIAAVAPSTAGTSAAPPAGAAEQPASEGAAAERQRIVDALEACVGNQTRAAKMLGVSRATLVTKLGIHRIPRPRK
ncbi:MAG: Sigma-54 dependent transcriptional regulator [Gemmatimonadetes bacterium]|nr:Sigma-54 dependent transcriptional regulator [Gemmatimonadota bacterium]